MEFFILGIGILFWLAGIAYVVYGILMAVDAAKSEQWGWFAVILIFMFPAAIIYHLVGRDPDGVAGAQRRRSRNRRMYNEQGALRDEVEELRAEVERLKRG